MLATIDGTVVGDIQSLVVDLEVSHVSSPLDLIPIVQYSPPMSSTNGNKFQRYLSSFGASGAEADRNAAEHLEVSVHTVFSWRLGRRIPRVPEAKRIAKRSRGKISWMEIYE
jgi:hypothetical protein